MFRALLAQETETSDVQRIGALREAVERLGRKSRSFYLASAVFEGRLRIDLIFLCVTFHNSKSFAGHTNHFLNNAVPDIPFAASPMILSIVPVHRRKRDTGSTK